jgi:hypothetical protein
MRAVPEAGYSDRTWNSRELNCRLTLGGHNHRRDIGALARPGATRQAPRRLLQTLVITSRNQRCPGWLSSRRCQAITFSTGGVGYPSTRIASGR